MLVAMLVCASLVTWAVVNTIGAVVVYRLGLHAAFGKRVDGTRHRGAFLVWLPFLAFSRVTHELERLFRRSTARDEVAPGLFVGRRPRATELPAGVALVIDLCAELGPSRGVRERCRYLALPTLDARAPEPATLERAVAAVLAADGPVLVHCAAGHGRSATVAAAVLLRRGMAATPAEAETFMRRARPRIRLSEVQRRALMKA